MAVKLLMTWDILPGQETEYFEFVVRDFLPGIQGLGLEPNDAWFTMYGDQPQIMTTAQIESMNSVSEILGSAGWDGLIGRLLEYVENFDYKVIPARRGFQL